MRLFSSPTERGVDYSITKSILDGTYERTEDDADAIRAFEGAVRRDKELRTEIGGGPPRILEEGLSRKLPGFKVGAAILAELSGKRLVSYTAQGEISPRWVVVPRLSGSIFVNADKESIPATACHEAWHRLSLDHAYDASMIGGFLLEQTDPLQLEKAKAKYVEIGADHEVAANIFSSIVNDSAFWRG